MYEATQELFKAIQDTSIENFKAALENNAGVNDFDDYGFTPLMQICIIYIATTDKNEQSVLRDMIIFLLEHGADPDIQDNRNICEETVEHELVLEPINPIVYTYDINVNGSQYALYTSPYPIVYTYDINVNGSQYALYTDQVDGQQYLQCSTNHQWYKLLAERTVAQNVKTAQMARQALLHMACESGNQDIVEIILTQSDPNIFLKDYRDSKPEDYIINDTKVGRPNILIQKFFKEFKQKKLFNAIYNADLENFQKYSEDRDIINIPNKDGSTPLEYIAYLYDTKKELQPTLKQMFSSLLTVFREIEIDINAQNAKGETVLHTICGMGEKDILLMLMKSFRVNINVQNVNGDTALHLACKMGNGNKDIIQILCEHPEIDISLPNNAGKKAIEDNAVYECFNRIKIKNEKLLFDAITYANWKSFRELLQGNVNINAFNKDGYTPLMYIIYLYHRYIKQQRPVLKKMAMLLLQQGCDINVQNTDGDTALHIAYKMGQKNINVPHTYEHTAFKMDHENIIYILRSNPQINVYLKNKQGKTPKSCGNQDYSSSITSSSIIGTFLLINSLILSATVITTPTLPIHIYCIIVTDILLNCIMGYCLATSKKENTGQYNKEVTGVLFFAAKLFMLLVVSDSIKNATVFPIIKLSLMTTMGSLALLFCPMRGEPDTKVSIEGFQQYSVEHLKDI
ncbi:hypothetical protein BIY23_02385 [Wolbachia pipientis]|uniref:Uncharacterized protein n=1 Tax=Wolbachia pipientis TaxID=955 RepID=A0A1E7QJW5_WOLPI|nr:ankyrin repeat domain-containing protein [Wolbachia pipientis]OEY86687.1 hypothetical protein BIY23_02385 [Wolbachia pipientis]